MSTVIIMFRLAGYEKHPTKCGQVNYFCQSALDCTWHIEFEGTVKQPLYKSGQAVRVPGV
jgi:hypothetical protein